LPFFDDVVAAFCSPPKAYTKDSDRSRVALGDIAFPVAVANLVAAIAIWSSLSTAADRRRALVG
jgi:hypothetical protein